MTTINIKPGEKLQLSFDTTTTVQFNVVSDVADPPVVVPPQPPTTVDPNAPLRALAAARGLIYGAASGWQFLHDDVYAPVFAKECGLLVPESELKMVPIRPSATTFKWSGVDWLLGFAQQHGMLFRGHTLIWHLALPDWFNSVNAGNAEQTMRTHVEGCCNHFKGKVHSWDVCNEVVMPADGRADGLRNSKWMQLMGPDYIDKAFRLAHAADPDALLVLNQDRLEFDGTMGKDCRKHTLALLRRLVDAKVPVHALGIESHLNLDPGKFDAELFRRFLADVASLGLKIFITELDVADKPYPADVATRDRLVADLYHDYLEVCLEQPAVTTVITWGLSDKYTWIAEQRPRDDKQAVRPLPLDASMAKKPAYETLRMLLS